MGLLLLGVPAAQSANLIPDAVVQGIAGRNGLPAGVSFSAQDQNARASVSDLAPRPGGRTLCVERLVQPGNSQLVLRPISIQAGHRYYFSCRVKMTGMSAGVYLGFADDHHKAVAGLPGDAVSTSPNVEIHGNGFSLRRCLTDRPDAFNRLDLTFTAPPDTAFVTISLNYSWTLGTAWFGDLELLPLDDAIAAHP